MVNTNGAEASHQANRYRYDCQ